MARLRYVVFLLLLAGCSNNSTALSVNPSAQVDKKLIEYGWDMPTVSFIHDNIDTMQKRPFDGVAFKLTGEQEQPSSAFDSRKWSETELQYGRLSEIKWGSFTSSFIVLWASNPVTMDWFDDQRWDIISANMQFFSKAIKVSQAKGVFFDPEFYAVRQTHSLWFYTTDIYPTTSRNDLEIMVRKCGAQFMNALQSEVDTFDFLSFYFLSESVRMSEGSSQANDYTYFELLPAFIYGMLDVAKPGIHFIDGNEPSYYFTNPSQYVTARELIAEKTVAFTPSDVQELYKQHIGIANALYLDYLMALRPEHDRGLAWDERLKWLKHNLYYSLKQADEYVWLYSEHANWWKDDISPDIEAAIVEIRQKIKSNEPLGFEINIPQ
jgi:hypothetical protein